MNSVLTKNQKKVYGWKEYEENGESCRIKATVRYDDECGNGHNTFAITGATQYKDGRGRWEDGSCGCIHEDIEKHFPELKPFIKWHLMSSDAPMHYVANTLYLASNRDCWGKVKGEPYNFKKSLKFRGFPVIFQFSQPFLNAVEKELATGQCFFEIVEVPHENKKGDSYNYGSKYTFLVYPCQWYEAPFDTEEEAKQFRQAFIDRPAEFPSQPTSWGEGKEPELEAARSAALWPDATLEDLQNKEKLLARLPSLLAEFKRDVEALGFVF